MRSRSGGMISGATMAVALVACGTGTSAPAEVVTPTIQLGSATPSGSASGTTFGAPDATVVGIANLEQGEGYWSVPDDWIRVAPQLNALVGPTTCNLGESWTTEKGDLFHSYYDIWLQDGDGLARRGRVVEDLRRLGFAARYPNVWRHDKLDARVELKPHNSGISVTLPARRDLRHLVRPFLAQSAAPGSLTEVYEAFAAEPSALLYARDRGHVRVSLTVKAALSAARRATLDKMGIAIAAEAALPEGNDSWTVTALPFELRGSKVRFVANHKRAGPRRCGANDGQGGGYGYSF